MDIIALYEDLRNYLKNEEKTDLLLVSYGRISEELFPAAARLKEEGILADLSSVYA